MSDLPAAGRFRHWDRRLIENAPTGERLDRLLIHLTRAANHSRLWFAIAAVLAVKKGSTRRGAARGVVAIAASSAIANAALKPLFPRLRPPMHVVPVNRNLINIPRSSSFPSGHSASAFAFATAVTLEAPAAGIVLLPLAATVAYSRVHVGVHWPSDVAVGALIGVVVANATKRWWPVARPGCVELGEADAVEPCTAGDGLLVLVNPSSGTPGAAPDLTELLPKAQVVTADVEGDVAAQLQSAIDEFAPRALGVLGGDGSVSLAAAIAIEAGLPLAVFAGGTLNHYARDTAVTLGSTVKALAAGRVRRIDLGTVSVDGGDPCFFINTASLGPYSKVVRIREKLESRIGKWPAAAIAAMRVMRGATPLDISIDGQPTKVWMIFVGNGRYQPSDGLPLGRESLCDGQLDVRYLRADIRGAWARAVLAMTAGMLSSHPAYVRELAAKISIDVDDEMSLATDGEVALRGRRFEFVAAPGVIRQFGE